MNLTNENIVELAARLAPANSELFVALLHELAKGRPVTPAALTAILDWAAERVTAVLGQNPDIEYDADGNIVGYGLTLRETPHVFEIDGRRLYVWCALDALIFPALIGRTVSVSSHCAASGEPVSLVVTPDDIRDVKPADAAMSLVLPQAASSVRQSFCCHVRFFAHTLVAEEWAAKHQGVEIVSVQEAFELGYKIGSHLKQAVRSARSG